MELMKITRDTLLKPLLIIFGIVEKKHSLAILTNVLIKKQDNQVFCTATNLEIQISTKIESRSNLSNWEFTVSARKFLDILKALPSNENISLILDNEKLVLLTRKGRFQLQTLPPCEFPIMEISSKSLIFLEVTQKQINYLLSMVCFAMAQQDVRYYLNGVLLIIESEFMRAVTTDGHRMAHTAVKIEKVERVTCEVIIPRKTSLELMRLLDDSERKVSIEISSNYITLKFENIELVSKLIDGKFPDFKRIIPKEYNQTFEIDREVLQASLQRVAILALDNFKGIRIQISNNQMKISASNMSQEEAYEEINISYDFPPLDVGFNVTYLLEMLANVKTKSVIWIVKSDPYSSALITIPNDEQFKYVVMPMRI